MMSPSEIRELAIERFGAPNKFLSTARELRFGDKGSTSVVLQGPKAGLWYSYEEGVGGTIRSAPHRERSARPRKPELSYDSESADKLRALVRNGLCDVRDSDAYIRSADRNVRDTPAFEYLKRRGIVSWPHSVMAWRRHGIAYLGQAADGSVLVAQIVPLRPDGTKNTDYWSDGVQKRTYCTARGWHHFAAVRMPGRGKPVLCEGPETGLSIWLATGRPVYACLGLAGMAKLRVGLGAVTLARDADAPGSKADLAFERVVEARRKLGQRVTVIAPPRDPAILEKGNKKVDFNDIHVHYGLDAVAKMFAEKKLCQSR